MGLWSVRVCVRMLQRWVCMGVGVGVGIGVGVGGVMCVCICVYVYEYVSVRGCVDVLRCVDV